VLSRLSRAVPRLVESRHTVTVAALVAVLLRLPALTRPIRADEAGFLLVARAWDPQPDSMFGPYWVDRPPQLIAVFKGLDLLGGGVAVRVLGALVCGLVVLLAARVAAQVATPRAVPWVAVLTAALVSNAMIDVVAVKGELLALPLVLGSILLTLHAVRGRSGRSILLALAAGLSAGLALGLKQNLASGLVFAAVLLVASRLTGRLSPRQAVTLSAAGVAGVAVTVLGTLAWARLEDVRVSTVWYAVYGIRLDAARVIADGTTDAPERRAWVLLVIALACGLLPVIAGLFAHLRTLWPDDPPVVAATVAVVAVDLVSLAAGGSYWRDYLFPLVPAAVLCAALLAGRDSRPGRTMRGVVIGSAASAAVAMTIWAVWNAAGLQEFDEVRTGEAIAAAAEPGDTLVAFGGRADLQDTSGLDSPYPYLWSVPMRTRDPEYADLRALLAGPDAPTWLVEWTSFRSWQNPRAPELERVVAERYVEHGTACNGRPIYLLRGLGRPDLTPRC
jgi:4-amino-4-deoxy-L-arabinose transferase-like glycosyltransferase